MESVLGPTGKFPEGKLNQDDEGEMKFAVFADKNQIIVNFNSPVMWFGMGKETAYELAKLLVKHADSI